MSSGKNGMPLRIVLTMILTMSLTGCASADLRALFRAPPPAVAGPVCPPPLGPLPDSVADALDEAVTADPDGAGSWVNDLERIYDFQDACAE